MTAKHRTRIEYIADLDAAAEKKRFNAETQQRLAAAAPDLLEAVKALLSAAGYTDEDEALKKARAAVEKAEGR